MRRTGFRTTTTTAPYSDGVDRKKYRALSDRLNAALCHNIKQTLDQFGVGDLYSEDASASALTELCERIMGQLFRTDYNRRNGPVFSGASTQLAGSRHVTYPSTRLVLAQEAVAARYIETVRSWGTSNPQYRKETLVDGTYAVVLVPAGPDRVYLQSLRSFRKGGGSTAMRNLLGLADNLGIAMELDPVPFGKESGPNKAALAMWYSRLGFQQLPGELGSMTRETKKARPKAASWRGRLGSLRLGKEDAPVVNTKYFRGNGVVFYMYALVTSKTGNNLPGVDAGFTKPVNKVPSSVASELSKPALVRAEEAAARGELWYISVGSDKEGKGWTWSKRNGAKDAAAVQDVLSFLLQYQTKHSVNGARAFYVEIANNFLGL